MSTPGNTKPTVLVVDDEAAIVEFIAYSLDLWGYPTITATSAGEALMKLKSAEKAPGLAIVDIAIGAESGLELANTLITTLKKLRILFISGYVNDMVMIDTMPNGTKTGFLQKVFTLDQLQESIDELQA